MFLRKNLTLTAGLVPLYLFLCFTSLNFFIHIWTEYFLVDPTKWDILPGFHSSFYASFGMFIHWIGGSILLLLNLIQILPISRSYDMRIHRVLGNLYIFAALITSVGGNIFIYTYGCVGGMNMNISFSIAGWIMFVFAVLTFYYAKTKNRTMHRNFAIRLFGQGIASGLYRVWYMLLGVFFNYQVNDFSDFHRPIDEALDWWFFVPNLVVTEIVVQYLNSQDKKRASTNTAYPPLLST